jgi:hypothetical protein
MLPTGYIAHHIPGRIRIRIPAARGDPGLLEQIRTIAESVPGVESVESNVTTGSVLIHYSKDAGQDFEKKLSAASHSGFELRSIRQGQKEGVGASSRTETVSTTAKAITAAFKGFDTGIRTATDNTLDLKVLLPMAAAAAAAFAAREALSTPLWLTLAIFAFSAFIVLHPAVEPGQSNGLVPGTPG